MDSKKYIFGHRNPDTDSICAAIGYARLKQILGHINTQAYRLGKLSNETKFVLDYFKVSEPELIKTLPEGSEVILVDHNERNQTIENINLLNIVEIIDHHRFSDLHTNEPLYIRAEAVGCSCTIIYKLYKENSIEIDKDMAGILLSAILSDTLVFKSPTCTDIDIKIGKELAKIAEVDIESYSKKLFEASSNLTGLSVEEILSIDRKMFVFGEHRVFISQINTTDYKSLHNQQKQLLNAMLKFSDENKSQLTILLVTDTTLNGSEMIAVGEQKQLVEILFKMPKNENAIYLDGVLSRKKQVVPILSKL